MNQRYVQQNPQQFELANAHRQHALLHQQQAQFHQQRAQFHHQQAQMFENQPPYDPRHTAYANVVSPAALVYRGEISPQSVASLREFYNPFGRTPDAYQRQHIHLSNHAAHATENQVALQRGHKF